MQGQWNIVVRMPTQTEECRESGINHTRSLAIYSDGIQSSYDFVTLIMTIKQDTDASASTLLADPSLLEKIDKLFACNVGEHINLPQLVVVGDQSSGKRSVLEGLTKLKFPRNSGLCTALSAAENPSTQSLVLDDAYTLPNATQARQYMHCCTNDLIKIILR